MVTLGEYSQMVSAIHAAAVTPDHWIAAMETMRTVFDSTSAGMITAEGASRQITSAYLPDDAKRAYSDYYRQVDYVLDAVEHGPVALVRAGEPLIALNRRSEFNADWMKPYRMDDGLFVRLTPDRQPTCFLVAASNGPSSFATPDRIAAVTALVPHLQLALRTERRLVDLRREAQDVAEAVDGMRHGVVVVGPGSKVLHANASGNTMLNRRAGVRIRSGRLIATSTSDDAELQRCVAEALGMGPTDARVGNAVLCHDVSLPRPYVAHVTPFASREDAPKALVVIVDPADHHEPSISLLRRVFGLTSAEGEVALRVARGTGLGPIADELCLSMATVKTHVQHIFDKTDTRRQAELVRLLLSIVP